MLGGLVWVRVIDLLQSTSLDILYDQCETGTNPIETSRSARGQPRSEPLHVTLIFLQGWLAPL